MSALEENSSLQMLTETLHALYRHTAALEKSIEKHLFFDNQDMESLPRRQDWLQSRKNRSFYKDLERRIDTHELNYYQLSDLLGITLRQFDYYRILVENLLGYVTGDQPLTLQKISLRLKALLQEVIDLFTDLAAERCIEIKLDIMGDPEIEADRDLIRRMFVNMLDNAIKYSYSGSKKTGNRFISISCRRHSTYDDWIIVFESYGVGIEKEEIETGGIFQYGTRGRLSKDRGRSGTGIGLAESKRIIEAHKGRIGIKSHHLEGEIYLTLVEVVLPTH